jgi:hypothetical protein
MQFNDKIYRKIISIQPSRVIGKSIRNIFFPENIDIIQCKQRLIIEISSICNAKCIFCVYRLNNRSKRLMPTNEFTILVKSAFELGYRTLGLYPLTGEVFTHDKAIELIKIAKKEGFDHISAYTNGILLFKHDIPELLISGINSLNISFPGFTGAIFEEVFGVPKFLEFKKSIITLLKTHRKLNSKITLRFIPMSYLTTEEIRESDFYRYIFSRFESDLIYLDETVKVFDSWAGQIKTKDLIKGMKADISPIKSIYPLKKVFLCNRLLEIGVLANGDVRLCNCRYDQTIETENDSLFIGNLKYYSSFADLIKDNKHRINKIRTDFFYGKLPTCCKKCPEYRPIKGDLTKELLE